MPNILKNIVLRTSGIHPVLFLAMVLMVFSCEQPGPDSGKPDDEDLPAEKFAVYEMDIRVEGNNPVVSKESVDYLNCTICIKGKGSIMDYQGAGKIRGRGNSSWLWYDKKPYRIKLNAPYSLLGLNSERDWVLLANYRDPTDLMNVFGFEASDFLGMPFTNHSRFVEVTLNGDYMGLYQLTDQVEQGSRRVDVSDTDGILICLDADDGPSLSPDAGDNFWSGVFELPVCVKYPEEPTANELIVISNDFARLETAILNYDYNAVDELMDIPSMIDYLIIQELLYNVEIDAPRSVFMHKDAGGKFVMGPVWDFDAGFDFDWGTMYTGHNFFNEQELVMGTDPANHLNGYRISDFFTQMFRNEKFVVEYKARWSDVKESLFTQTWTVMEEYIASLHDAMARDYQRWPIDRNYETEIGRMKDWLTERVEYLTDVIENYPAGHVPVNKTDCGSLSVNVTLSYALGYDQVVTVDIDEDTLIAMLQISPQMLNSNDLKLVPLKTDGSEGLNNTNGIYGAWFEGDNNPGFWANGHVYIEVFENITMWNCGMRSEEGFCSVGEQHSVKMQYQYISGTEAKTVTVTVNFLIGE